MYDPDLDHNPVITGALCDCGDYITNANHRDHRNCSRISDIESEHRRQP